MSEIKKMLFEGKSEQEYGAELPIGTSFTDCRGSVWTLTGKEHHGNYAGKPRAYSTVPFVTLPKYDAENLYKLIETIVQSQCNGEDTKLSKVFGLCEETGLSFERLVDRCDGTRYDNVDHDSECENSGCKRKISTGEEMLAHWKADKHPGVWDILSRGRYTREGQQAMEDLYMFACSLIETNGISDAARISKEMNCNLYAFMTIMDELLAHAGFMDYLQ